MTGGNSFDCVGLPTGSVHRLRLADRLGTRVEVCSGGLFCIQNEHIFSKR